MLSDIVGAVVARRAVEHATVLAPVVEGVPPLRVRLGDAVEAGGLGGGQPLPGDGQHVRSVQRGDDGDQGFELAPALRHEGHGGGGAGRLGNPFVRRRSAQPGLAFHGFDVGVARREDDAHQHILEALRECLLRRHLLANPEVASVFAARSAGPWDS